MSPHASPLSPSAVITRLRQAGCVFAEQEAALIATTARTPHELTRMVDLRSTGIPLEHVLGWARFHGLRLTVDPGVFVPRPRTEFLAEQALALTRPGALVVDLCCGTGALGAVLATHHDYVPTREIALLPAEVREHESRRSLDGGPDGLDVVRRVAAQARAWLAPGAHLLVQAHPDQVSSAQEAFARGALVATSVTCTETDTSVVLGRRPHQ